MSIIIPESIIPAAQSTFVVGFGDAVREHAENGDVDREHAAVEAEQWTFSNVYRAGFEAGAAWVEGRR